MTRPLQKRKQTRPSFSVPRSKSHARTESQKSRATIRSNPLLARHWDYELTARQNYGKLGVVKKLRQEQGSVVVKGQQHKSGVERRGAKRKRGEMGIVDGGAEGGKAVEDGAMAGEMRVVRGKDGRILRVVREAGAEKKERREEEVERTAAERTWGSRRLEGEEDGDEEVEPEQDKNGQGTRLVDQLEEQAARQSQGPPASKLKKLSPREKEWCAAMVAKHGVAVEGQDSKSVRFDWEAAFRDSKMNVWQLSKGQMKEKVKRYVAKEHVELIEEEE